jgi:hypothetical protein
MTGPSRVWFSSGPTNLGEWHLGRSESKRSLVSPIHLSSRTYSVHMVLSYIYCAYELIKFIKNLNFFIYFLSILLHLCIKFQCKISNNEVAIKKIKFLIDL